MPQTNSNIPSIVCYGELLIDMISKNTGSLIDSEGFYKKFGGAPANTAVGLAKLGAKVSFIGKVGNDPFGAYLKRKLEYYKVDTSHLIMSKKDRTTLAFVSLTEEGERDFYFFKGAHDSLKPADVDLPKDTYLFHFGSLTQTNTQADRATRKLLDQALVMNAMISYDPNIRENLWGDLDKAKRIILETAKKVHILKLNDDEAKILSGKSNVKDAAKALYSKNLDALFITLGEDGCYYKTKTDEGQVRPAIIVKSVDTTGAGDAFNAGYIDAICKMNKHISDMTHHELESALKRAVVIGAITTTKKGAISAFPKPKELYTLLHHNI
jgi:sugar/nucleoside kinase (ribokinase family)